MQRVTAAVIERDGTYLIARRAFDQPHPGRWEFPGGKVEADESLEACLARELKEEFGVIVKVGRLIATSRYEYPGGAIQLLAYDTEIVGGVFELRVHDRVEWVASCDLLNFDLLPADVPIAAKLAEMDTAHQRRRP